MNLKLSLVLLALCCCFAQPSFAAIEIANVTHQGPVDFEKEILPLLKRNCLACHNAGDAESDLVLETPETIRKGGVEGPAAVAGKSAESLLLMLASHQKEPIMPPADNKVGAKPFSSEELGLIKLWIDQGAAGEVSGGGPLAWQALPPGVQPIYAAAVTSDGQWAAAGRANQVFMFHLPSKREMGRLTDPELLKSEIYSKPGVAHFDLVQSLAFSPDGMRLASGGYRTVKIWKKNLGSAKSDLTASAPVRTAVVSRSGKWAALGLENGAIDLFDLQSGQKVHTLTGHTGPVKGLAFNADDSRLLSGSADKSLRLWNPAEGKPIGEAVATAAEVNGVAFVSGQQVASAGADNIIRLWSEKTVAGEAAAEPPPAVAEGEAAAPAEPAPPAPTKEIQGHGGAVTALVALAEGTRLLSGSADGTLRVWNVEGGNQLAQLNHGAPIEAIAASGDGKRFASASSNGTAKLFNGENNQQIAELKGDFRTDLAAAALERASQLAGKMVNHTKNDLAEAQKRKTSEEENQKKAMEAKQKAETEMNQKIEAAKKPVADKEQADQELAAAKEEHTKAEAEKTAKEEAFQAADAALKDAQQKRDQANQGEDQAAKDAAQAVFAAAETARREAEQARNTANQTEQQAKNKLNQAENKAKQLEGPAQKALDEKTAAERAYQAAVRSVERAAVSVQTATEAIPAAEQVQKQAEEKQTKQQQEAEAAKKLIGESVKPVLAIAFSPDGSVLATAGEDQQVHTWSAENGSALEVYPPAGQPLKLLTFTPGGELLSGGAGPAVSKWNPAVTWELERTIGATDAKIFADRITALDFSSDGKQLAAGGGEPSRGGEIKIINVENGQITREFKEPHSDVVFALEFSPDDAQIASCGADRFIKIHQVADGAFVRAFEGHTHHVLGVSWQSDGRVIASSGADNVVKVWNALTGEQIRTINGFNKEITSLRFVGNNEHFALSCGDRNVSLRNTNGNNIRNYGGSTDFVYCVAVSDDGKAVIAGGQDGVLRVWEENGQVQATFAPPQPEQTTAAN